MPGGRPRKLPPAPEPPSRRKPGTGSVSFHRPSQRWRAILPPSIQAEVRETYHPTRDGAISWLDGELLRDARAAALAARAGLAATIGVSPHMTFGDWLGHWFAITAPSANWSMRTRKIYQDHIWQFSPVHDVLLADLTTTRLQEVVAALMTTGAARRPGSRSKRPITPLSASSAHEAAATIRRALVRARDDGLIPRNPAASLVIPRVVRKRPTIWTADERRKLAPHIAHDDLEALWRLLFELGLRIGEALALQWGVIDFDQAVLTVRRIVFKDGRVQEWAKGNKWRDVDVTTRTLGALKRLRDRQPEDTTWVFEHTLPGGRERYWTHEGKRYRALWSYDGIRYRLQRLTKRAGVPYHSCHTGRHNHATKMLLDGVPAADAAERLGHADGSITIRLYGSPSMEGRKRALASAESSLEE